MYWRTRPRSATDPRRSALALRRCTTAVLAALLCATGAQLAPQAAIATGEDHHVVVLHHTLVLFERMDENDVVLFM